MGQGFVSDQANEFFSKMEINFLRNSPISIARWFLGSGKRGSLSQSKVHVMVNTDDKEDVELGYQILNKPKIIPQMKLLLDNEVGFSFDKSDGNLNSQLDSFSKNLKTFDWNFIELKDDRINILI